MMQAERRFWHIPLIAVLSVLAVSLVYFSPGLGDLAVATARYALFIPVVYAARFYGLNGGIAASLGLSTLLVALVVGRALAAGDEQSVLDIATAIVGLNLVGYFWGALAGAQRQQRRLYQQMYTLAQQVTLDPRDTAGAVLEAVLANVPASGGLVALTMDPDFILRVLASRGLSSVETMRLEEAFRENNTVIEWAITSKCGQILNRPAMDPRFAAGLKTPPRSLLVVPLSRGEEICGGVVLFDRSGWEGFSPSDLEWLTRLAERASVALENSRLYSVSQAVAEENARYYKELKVYANELDRLVDERTRALSKALADLKAAEADLLQTSRLAALGELAGRVAHEILNPLTAILGRLQARLTELEKDGGQQQPPRIISAILNTWRAQERDQKGLGVYFDTPSPTAPELTCGQEDLRDLERLNQLETEAIEQQCADLSFLEGQTLRLVRMVEGLRELGRRNRTLRRINLSEIAHEAAEVMQSLLRRNQIVLVVTGLAELPPVLADPDELVQVLTNLLRNAAQAVKESGRGSGKVVLDGRVNDNRVEISIIDDGIGISAENRERIFEAGFTTKPREEGTGLGLSISRRFVRECHGDVELLTSKPGQGSTFLIWFPLDDDQRD